MVLGKCGNVLESFACKQDKRSVVRTWNNVIVTVSLADILGLIDLTVDFYYCML